MSLPPDDRHRGDELMRAAMDGLQAIFPECAVVLLVTPFDAPVGGRVNYISNGKREDIVTLMREVIARFEGRAHDAPERPQ